MPQSITKKEKVVVLSIKTACGQSREIEVNASNYLEILNKSSDLNLIEIKIQRRNKIHV